MESSKKILLTTIFIAVLVVIASGITFAFFNYTRTGLSNTIRVGRIYFNTNQTDTINLTNVFPISSSEATGENDNYDSIEITITGDTTYSNGVEYLVSLTDVNNTAGIGYATKQVPLSFNISASNGLGTNDEDYYDNRGGSSSIYKIVSRGFVRDDAYILVGYIANGQTGINGTLTIKAFIDKDRISISDTYPEQEVVYSLNKNMTPEELDYCISFFEPLSDRTLPGESIEGFCQGTSTLNKYVSQQLLDNIAYSNNGDIEGLIELNVVVKENYSNGTTRNWVGDRVVFTTDEWNSFNSSGLSFKVKVEANEGIWVDKETTSKEYFSATLYQYYSYNYNRNEDDINECVNYLDVEGASMALREGESLYDYCAGTGTLNGQTIIESLKEQTTYSLRSYDTSSFDELNDTGVLTVSNVAKIDSYDGRIGESDIIIPEKIQVYKYNENRTEENIIACANFFNNTTNEEFEPGDQYYDLCAGTGQLGNFFIHDFISFYARMDSIMYAFKNMNIAILSSEEYPVKILNCESFDYNVDENFVISSIEIPNNIEVVGDNVFYESKVPSLTIDMEYIISNFLTSSALRLDSITKLTIGNHVKKIEQSAFAYANMTSVEIPESVTSIGPFAFSYNANLMQIIVPDSKYSDYTYNCDGTTDNTIADEGVTIINKSGTNSCTIAHS